MQPLLLFSFLVAVRSYCYYVQSGTEHFCQECCFWFGGEWHCETYQYCYTFLGIILAIWCAIIGVYAGLYFYAKNKTARRLRVIFERSINCQMNNTQDQIPKNQELTTQTTQINVVELKEQTL